MAFGLQHYNEPVPPFWVSYSLEYLLQTVLVPFELTATAEGDVESTGLFCSWFVCSFLYCFVIGCPIGLRALVAS